jgi:hypothetical protein
VSEPNEPSTPKRPKEPKPVKEDAGEEQSQEIDSPKQQAVERRPREKDDDTRYIDTTYTLRPLEDATAQDWLGSNQDPDVLLSIPNLGIDRIAVNIEGVRAHATLDADVLDLVKINVGVDVSIDKVEIEVDNVRVQALLKVRLDNVKEIVHDVVDLFKQHPEILANLTGGIGEGLRNKLSDRDVDRAIANQEAKPTVEQKQEADNKT